MAYLIIGLLIFFVLVWATYMSKASKDPNRKVKMEKPKYLGGPRRYARAGRVIVQTDEQRSENHHEEPRSIRCFHRPPRPSPQGIQET